MKIFLLDYLYETKRPVLMENINLFLNLAWKNYQMIRMKKWF